MSKVVAEDGIKTEYQEEFEISLAEVCRITQTSTDMIFELVDYGVIEPRGSDPRYWNFESRCIGRILSVMRLQNDLGVNMAGAALAVDLLEELQHLRARIR